MKNVKKLVALIMSAAMVMSVPAFVSGCTDGEDDGTHTSQEGSAVKVKDISDVSVKVDEEKTLTVSEYVTANGNAVTVSSAANGSVIAVSFADGVITVKGKAKGEATVTVKCGEVELSFRVTVTEAASVKPAPVFEDLVKTVDLNEGALEVTLAPKSGGEDFNVTYSLANNLIHGAEIKDGKLKYTPTAKGSVEVTVNARCEDKTNAQNVQNVSFKVKITVTENVIPVYYTVTIDGVAQQVEEGGTVILPEYTKQVESGKEFKGWKVGGDETLKSPNSSITVTGDLVITAVIGDVPATAPEKIKDGEDIKFYLSEHTATINVAEYINTNGHTVSVSSSETGVATAGESGGTVTVTAVAAGKTVVTLTCKNIVVTFNVTVKNAAPTFANVNLKADLYKPATSTVTHEIVPEGADTFTYEYTVDGGATVTDGVFSYTATEVGTKTFTVNVTATDGETEEEETATFTVTVTVTDTTAYRIVNGDFETGNTDGWTLISGEAFGAVSNDDKFFTGASYGKDDGSEWLFTGAFGGEHGTNGEWESKKGVLKSESFTLKQNGWISFKLGGAHNLDCGLRVRTVDGDVILAEFNNQNKGVDGVLDSYKYKFSGMDSDVQCYIEIFDNASGGWGLVVLDDICTYYTDEPQNATLITPYYEKGRTKVLNGGFGDGITGWLSVTNEEGKSIGFIGVADATWGDGTKSYNNDGQFFQNGDEAATGYLLSSVFEVSDNGWMTFKLGGNNAHSHVAIVDAETGEELAKFVNKNFVGAWPNQGWEMYSYKVNLIESGIAAGREVRIKVVDGATSDYGVIVADSFVTDYADEPTGNFEKIDKVTE